MFVTHILLPCDIWRHCAECQAVFERVLIVIKKTNFQGHHRLHSNLHLGQEAGNDYQVDWNPWWKGKDSDNHLSQVLSETLH